MINSKKIESGPDTDAAIARLVASSPATAALWQMTSDVLHRRAGWALYVGEEGDYAWLFGWEGQGLLVVSVEPYGIDAYHHREDETATVNSARELWEWLKLREDDEDAKGGAEVTELRRQLREMSDEKLAETLP